MSGCTSYGRWVVVLWAVALLSVGASAAPRPQTATLKIQGMV